VSTASARRVEVVEATPFYVSAQAPGYGIGMVSSGIVPMRGAAVDDLDEYAEEEGLMEVEELPEMVETYAAASETLSGTMVYEIPGYVTIPSGQDPQPITLTEEEFTSKRLYYWNAYAMPEVVAQDEITNGESVMLPGNVRVYASGDFLGETSLQMIAPRETFRLGTRVAYDAKAEKKLVLKDTEKAGLTRGKKRRGYRYRLELKSFAKDPIEMKVVDRIPHSNSEKIIVELKPMDPAPIKSEMGVLEWEVKIEPQKELNLEYFFEVEWEKDIQIRPPLP
ncbi:MAG: mucoidy inhibitor MuiA family protein, partial [Candidatus Hodarchaeota archaeon]